MKNNEKKFTLVEIMIVIAIIAILSAIAIPNYASYRKTALDKEAENKIMMVKAAKERFAMDYGKASTYVPDFDDLKPYLSLVDTVDDLKVGGESMDIKAIKDSPVYPTYGKK